MTRAQQPITVVGLKDIEKVLNTVLPRHARNIMRATIHGVASDIAKDAKTRVPKDTGNLRKSIKAKRRKSPPNKPVSDVMITQGLDAKHDGFYWRFVEYGQGFGMAQPFIAPARHKAELAMPQLIEKQFTKKLAAASKREQKKRAKKL